MRLREENWVILFLKLSIQHSTPDLSEVIKEEQEIVYELSWETGLKQLR